VAKSSPVAEKMEPEKSRPSQVENNYSGGCDTQQIPSQESTTNMLNDLFYNYHGSELEDQRKPVGGPVKLTSVYSGVHRDMSKKDTDHPIKFLARFDNTYMGSYSLETDAALAYDAAIRARRHARHYGKVNFTTKDSYLKERAAELKSNDVSEAQKPLEQILAYISSNVSNKIVPLDDEEEELLSFGQKTSGQSSLKRRKSSSASRPVRPVSLKFGDDATFPEQLYDILSVEEYSDIISWAANGNGFKIYDFQAWEGTLLPFHFNATQQSSFTRRLQRWGFERISKGPELGLFYNSNFIRGKPELLDNMYQEQVHYYDSAKKDQKKVGAPKRKSSFEDSYDYGDRSLDDRKHHDGSVLPAIAPIQLPDGSYQRPVGRAPRGCDWNYIKGVWIPTHHIDKPNTSSSDLPQPKKRKSQATEDNAYEKTYQYQVVSKRSSASKRTVVSKDETTVSLPMGVRHMPSGNYEVGIVYQGKRRSIGTFNTLDDAVLANEVARGMLKAESGQLSAEQAARNVQSAKDAIKASGVVTNTTPGRPRSIINNNTPVKEKKKGTRRQHGTFARPRGAGKVGFEWDYTRGVWAEISGFEQSSTTKIKIKKPVITASQTAPRQLPDGTFAKPCGRGVKGCDWDASRGVWVPLSELPQRKKRHSQAREDNAYTKTYNSKRSSASRSRSPVMMSEKKVPVDKLQEGPRQLLDGTFARPRGKGRAGFDWDYTKGLWVAQASSADEEDDEVQEAAPQAKSMLSGLFGK